MSVQPKSWRLALQLHGPTKPRYVRLPLMVLATWVEGPDGEFEDGAHPTLEDLARGCNMSPKAVRERLLVAAREGWIVIDTTCDPEEYRLRVPDAIANLKFHLRQGHEVRRRDGRVRWVEPMIVGRRIWP